MNRLLEIRDKIDSVDKEIVRLFEERVQLAGEVAEYKISIGKEVLDRQREKEKIAKVKSLTHTEFNAQGVESLFEQLMTISRLHQYTLMAEKDAGRFGFFEDDMAISHETKVVFAGVRGAFGQQAMDGYFGTGVDSFNVETFKEAMDVVERGEADYGVLPIENSSTGIITDVYDLLADSKNYIAAVIDVKVEQSLLVVPGTTLADIHTVYSHPQGLLQCRQFLKDKHWEEVPLENTSIAAMKVSQDQDKGEAAIASVLAAKMYGLEVMAQGINDIDNNTTRFIIIKNKPQYKPGSDRISICFQLPHSKGTLYRILSHFIFNNLNMTKIESRPIRGEKFKYRFFVDFDGNLTDKNVISALTGIMAETECFRILGCYISLD